MTFPTFRKSPLACVCRLAGSTWTGIGVIGLIVVYLALASTAPGPWADLLGTRPANLYRHWLLVALGVMLCLSVLAASLLRLKLNSLDAGAWCSHLGVLVLASGAGWYALAGRGGLAVTRHSDQGWSAVDRFYLDGTAAIGVSASDGQADGRAAQTSLPVDPDDRSAPARRLDLALAGGPADVRLRAAEYLPAAEILYDLEPASAGGSPAAALWLQDGPYEGRIVLSDQYPYAASFARPGYTITFHGGTSPETLKRITSPKTSQPGPGLGEDLIMIVTGKDISPTLVLVRPNGKMRRVKLAIGQAIELVVADRPVRITPERFLDRATAVASARPVDPSIASLVGTAAVRVEIRAGETQRSVWLPFDGQDRLEGPANRPVDLPGGRAILLAFGRQCRPLPARVEVLGAQYKTHPGSVVPKDYRCTVRVAGRDAVSTISLNNPLRIGSYQISQGSWLPSAEAPEEIVFVVASRVGLGVIWLGCILIAAGLPYAFYVKPLIARRRAKEPAR